MPINPKSVEFHQCHINRHSICFFNALSRITKEIFVKICWQLKTPTRTWKCTRCIMQMSYLYASDFPFKNFRKLAAQHTETIRKKCLGKELWRVLVVDKSTDHEKPHLDLFSATISTSKKMFFIQSASWKRHCATHWREQRSMVGTL